MFNSISRFLLHRSSYGPVITQAYSTRNNTLYVKKADLNNQIDFIKSIDDSNPQSIDWEAIKSNVLSMRGNLNQKNADAVILKVLVTNKNLVAASLFAQHLKKTREELNLGSINSMLFMYTIMGKEDKLTEKEHALILDIYENLLTKYKILDSSTGEQLLHALCTINDWERALKVLNDIHLSSVPTHSAYSTLISTLFRLNKKKKAMELIEESVKHKRPLQYNAYDEWLNFILRKYKDKNIIAKYLEEVLQQIGNNWAVVSEKTANRLRDFYIRLDWNAEFTRIKRLDGQCSNCKDSLNCLTLSDEEFNTLQNNVKDKLIIGSDLLLKTTHEELKRFLDFVETSAPYDVVLDGLNICYTVGSAHPSDRLQLLNHVVEHFCRQNKKILLLGRQHMLRWNKNVMQKIMSKTLSFFTENLSQDDPFFITAAILSGPHTDIMSKDLLRGHKFNLKDDELKQLFKRWQWQHQWMIFLSRKGPVIQPPMRFTPCAQKKGSTWHIPYENENAEPATMINDGIPDLRSWLCLKQKL